MREYKEIYKYEQYKRCSQVKKRKLERRVGGVKGKNSGRSADDPHFRCTTLISN